MASVERIGDPEDPRIEAYRGVRDPSWLRERGLFLAEGRSVVRELLAQPRFRARSLLVTETAWTALERELGGAPSDVAVYVGSPAVLRATSGVAFHQGCVAEAAVPPEPSLESLIESCGDARRPLVLLERLSDPDNVGSVFRNALAFGAGAVVLSPGCASPLYRKALRTSLGAALQVPFATDAAWPDVLDTLARRQFAALAFTPAAGSRELHACLGTLPHGAANGRVALLFGSEGDGLTPAALAACAMRLRIAMREGADSVNVATASGIALHHFFALRAVCQRR